MSTENRAQTEQQHHPVIWLAPWCDECQRHCYRDEGRTWCEDEHPPCEECGRPAVKYVLAPDQSEGGSSP